MILGKTGKSIFIYLSWIFTQDVCVPSTRINSLEKLKNFCVENAKFAWNLACVSIACHVT